MSVDLVKFLNQYSFEYVIKATGQKIKFRPITTGQMKHLLTYEDSDKESIEDVLDTIINECVITEGFDVMNITVQDRFDLLVEIRKRSKSEVYTFMFRCPECDVTAINSVNLDELEVKPFPTKIDNVVKLSTDLSVEMTHITRAMQKEVFDIVESMGDLSELRESIETYMYIFASSMTKFTSPAGEIDDVPLEEKIKIVENLDEKAFDRLHDWFNNNDYGTVFKYQLKCKECDFSQEEAIPITDFFV